MEPEKKKKISVGKMMGIVIGVLLIACVIVIAILMQSKSVRFIKALTSEQYLISSWKDGVKKLKSNGEKEINFEWNTTVLNYFNIPVPSSASGKLKYNGKLITQNDDLDFILHMSENTAQENTLEVIKNGDTIALAIPSLFENYISMNEENTDRVLEKLGIAPRESASKEDTLLMEESLETIAKYIKLAFKGMDDLITIEKNQNVIINNKEKITTLYQMNIGSNDLKRMTERVLGSLKDDDEALHAIAKVFQKMYGVSLPKAEEKEYVEDLKDSIKQTYENIINIEDDDENTLIYQIKLYSEKHKTIKMVLESYLTVESKMTLETISHYAKFELTSENATPLAFVYKSSEEDGYEGSLSIMVSVFPLDVFKVSMKEIRDSEQKVRKIETLDAFLLNDASDEELEIFRASLDNKLSKIFIKEDEEELDEGVEQANESAEEMKESAEEIYSSHEDEEKEISKEDK